MPENLCEIENAGRTLEMENNLIMWNNLLNESESNQLLLLNQDSTEVV